MTTIKTKLKYPKYPTNRLKRVCRVSGFMDDINTLAQMQIDRANNHNISLVRKEMLEQKPWTLSFDGKDFWFETSKEYYDQNSAWFIGSELEDAE